MKMKWMVAVAAASVVMIVAAGCGGGSNAAPAAAANSSQAQAQTAQGNNPQGSTGSGQGQPAAAGTQAGGRQFNPNNFAAGQVSNVNGNTIELTTNNGALTVKASDQTQVQKQVAASLSDVQTGERILAQGTREADGSFTAQTIELVGQRNFGGGTPGPRGGNGGGGGGAGPNAQNGNGQGRGQNGGGQFNPNNFATGQVSKIDGKDIELTAANGVTLTVHTGDQTKFQKMGQGTLSDITSGERITVRGTRAADGTFTAQMIQVGGGLPGGGNPAQAPAQNSNGNQ